MKTIFYIFVFAFSLFAVDSSHETGVDQNFKRDSTISAKKSQEEKQSQRESKSQNLENSFSQEISFDTFPIFLPLADECVKFPKSIADFGVSANVKGKPGMIDLVAQQYFEATAKNNAAVSTAKMDQAKFKKHIKCLFENGAKIAQANINFSQMLKSKNGFDEEEIFTIATIAYKRANKIENPNIKNQLLFANESLKTECSFFNGLQTVKCGSLIFDFAKNELSLANATLYGYNKVFGIDTSYKVAINSSASTSKETSNEDATTKSKEASLQKSKSQTQTAGSKSTLDLKNIMPSVQ